MNPTEWERQIRQNLKDAGFDEQKIEEFLEYDRTGKTTAGVKMLGRQRELLLDEIHDRQRNIDCLDYLLYQIRKGK